MSNTISIPATLTAIKNTEAHINEMLARPSYSQKELDFEYDYLACMQTTLKMAERRARRDAFLKRIFRK